MVFLFGPAAPVNAVVHGRCDEKDGGERRTHQVGEVRALLDRVRQLEALVERQHQKEGEENLHAGQLDAQLLERGVELLVQMLLVHLEP